MSINLRHLNLEALDLKNSEYMTFLNRVENYSGVKDYISSNFMHLIKEPLGKEKVEPGATYLIKDVDNIIGLIGTKPLDSNGIIELWCIISPTERNKGYATKTLVEITPYLIENIQGLNDIKLVIDRKNISSIKSAENACYIKMDVKDNDKCTYRYFGK